MTTTIIAEAGVNHNGDLAMALALVDAASAGGADVVKFQTFRADRLVTASARKAAYQMGTSASDETQYEMLRRLELSDAMHEQILARCRARSIEFMSTAFDLDSLDYLAGLGVGQIKIPSGEITNLPYLRKAGALGKRVLLSTGMSNMGDIEAAIDVIERAGTARDSITVLQCTTEYPAPFGEVNLRAIQTIRDTFKVSVGFSDHTEGLEAAIAAVALGATVVEKHITLDRALPGPDHRASIEPAQLEQLVRSIRNVELAMGDGIKRPTQSEDKNRLVARRSLVAARPIVRGEPYTEHNVAAKRPGIGISPMRLDEVMGRPAPRDFATDEAIEI